MRLFIVSFLLLPGLALAEVPSFAPFQKILNKHLQENNSDKGFESYFNYSEAFKDPEVVASMEEQKKILAEFKTAQIKTKNEAMAFWINAYNFFMIYKIYKDGFKDGKLKINSVRDLGSWINRYAAFTEKDFVIGGETMHLDDIEKGWLLSSKGDFKDRYKDKGWKDARVHFAVNCASVGCPPLRKNIYTPDNVDATLDANTRMAFKTHRHLHFKGKELWVTHLFKWYDDDFKEASGSVQKFIAKYVDDADLKKRVLATDDDDIKYIEYDWKLNHRQNF